MVAPFLTLSLSLPSTDSVQRADLLLYQHRGSVHPLPRRGLPEAGLPGDQGVHPGSPALPEGKSAAGESEHRFTTIATATCAYTDQLEDRLL